ncbi:MAG TPA: IPT/TIG domain-containing protein [Bryobacteraceae bacterium]|jgi:uncharacterized protein (TIGR03437 family)|nr:IPT/TIG domain-containing protein [Bryobacteraceae bacterium]
MRLRQNRSRFPKAALILSALAIASAQTQDTSGNGLLKGNFAFRHLAVQNVDSNFDPSQVTASYGIIAFDGNGNYKITGTSVDNTVSGGSPQALSVTGTYAIGSNGAGYVANPLFPTDSNRYVYGASSQGVYTGSSTEAFGDGSLMNDIFIAIPLGAAPTNASFTSSYQTGLLDFTGGGATQIENALFELSPTGKGTFGTISLNGQASNQSAETVSQTVTGATYNFNSDGSATLTIPLPARANSTTALFTGTKTIFESADGNFILGWTAGGYDVFFGIKALAVAGTNSLSQGLYFTAALEDFSGVSGTDSFYGGISNSGDSAGDGVVHERLNIPGEYSYDFGTDDQIVLNSDGSTGIDLNGYQYLFGDGGQAFVGIGTGGYFSLVVGLHAASFSGKGVYLNPIGVVNAASYQPITASLAPGELIDLFGTGLASSAVTTPGGQAFPTSLGGVSVTIDTIPCPIYYVSPTQLSVIVPYGVASNMSGLANIQVTNNGVQSNVVQMYLTDAAPGAFSQNASGIGLAAALHAATGGLITSASPAQPGEYISLYLTGLGPVSPTVTDGVLGPSSPLSVADVYNAGNLSVYFNDYGQNGSTGNQGTIEFAGLAPSLAGLYQINVQVPTSGLASGDNVYIEFVTDAADVNQIQIPYGSASGRAVKAAHPRTKPRRQPTTSHRLRRGA